MRESARKAWRLLAFPLLLLLVGCGEEDDGSASLRRAERHFQAAMSYKESGEEEKAIHEYTEAITSSPAYMREKLWAHLGRFCLEMERYDDAEKAFQTAIKMNPSSPEYHFLLGFTHYKSLADTEAEKHFKEALKLNPSHRYAYLCLADIYLRQDDPERARGVLSKAISLDPKDPEAHYQMGIACSRQGDVKRALRELKKAAQADPQQYVYHYRLGRELLRFGRQEEGAKELEIYKRLYKKVVARRAAEKKVTKAARPPAPKTLAPSDVSVANSVEFVDATASAGINFKHYSDVKDTATILETTGSGAAFIDYDNDGNLDIYFVNCSKLSCSVEREQPHNALGRNMGGGFFVDVTEVAGVGDTGYGMGCVFGDYDNDGDDDLYVTNYGANVLYRNDGDGSFTDVTALAGVGDSLWGTGSAFADYDGDGDLDLFVANYLNFDPNGLKYCYIGGIKTGCTPGVYEGQPDILYVNNGDGTFTDVTTQAGISGEPGIGFGVAFGDYDNDGDDDIYVANDTTENFLYRNNGDGTFANVALLAGVSCDENGIYDSGMGVDFGDCDNDGNLEIFVTNFQNRTNTFYHNEGNGFFADASRSSGLGSPSFRCLGFGTKLFDYNNDGYLDVFVANGHVQDNVELFEPNASYRQRNHLFVNNRDCSFIEVSRISGDGFARKKASRGAAVGDYDNDGDLDILVTNSNDTPTLLRNEGGNKKNYLAVRLVGVVSNRSGLGTRVRVKCGRLVQIRELRSGASFLSDHDRRLFFGLDDYDAVESLNVRWPSGITQRFENVPANELLVVKETVE